LILEKKGCTKGGVFLLPSGAPFFFEKKEPKKLSFLLILEKKGCTKGGVFLLPSGAPFFFEKKEPKKLSFFIDP